MTKTLITALGTDSVLDAHGDSILINLTWTLTADDFDSTEDLIDFLHDDEITILSVDDSIAHLL